MKISPTDAELRSKFTPFASGLYAGKQDIRAIQVFPEEGAVLVYPIEGNEATIGRTLDDLINDERPDVRADVQRTIQTRQIAISGPYELRQGGLGMVARLAIYQEDTFLGLAVIVLDMPPLLEAGGLANPQSHIGLALKDSSGQILTGSEDVFSDNPVTYTIVLPDGEWELAAMPLNGWTASIRNSLRIFQWTGLLIIALATSLAYLITNRQARLTLAVQEHTAALTVSMVKREQANEALRESERRLREMLENIQLIAVLLDLEGRVTFCNEFLLQISGYTRDEVLGHDWFAQFAPDARADVKEAFLQGLKRGEIAAHYENQIRTKSGEERSIRFNNTILRDGQGKIIGTTSLGEDITERKQAEEALRESEERYRLFIETSPYGIGVHQDGKIVFANPAAARIFGAARVNELVGKPIMELIHPQNRDAARERIGRMLQGETGLYPTEDRYLRLNGSVMPVEVIAAPFTHQGHPAIQVIVQDITERKRAESALRESEARFRAFVTTSSDVLYRMSPDWSEMRQLDGRGFIADTINPSNTWFQEYIDADDQPHVMAVINEAIRTRTIFELEHRVRQVDGTLGWTLSRAIPLFDAKGEIVEWFGAAKDVTERKRAEEEVRLSRDRLAELSRRLVEAQETEQRAIGRELHDQVGQMLTALKLTLEIVPQLPADRSAQKLAGAQELVDDLMNRVSRLSLELRPPMLDDLGLVPALTWHVNRFQEQTGIEVDFKHSGTEGRRFGAEIETTAYRVIQEALTNVARHARGTRARLEVRVRGEGMEIQIEDDGAGFDPQVAFAKNRGLGGMRERVGLLNGTFRVESQTGKGARIFIALPLKENA